LKNYILLKPIKNYILGLKMPRSDLTINLYKKSTSKPITGGGVYKKTSKKKISKKKIS
jgi:hypothetical protein